MLGLQYFNDKVMFINFRGKGSWKNMYICKYCMHLLKFSSAYKFTTVCFWFNSCSPNITCFGCSFISDFGYIILFLLL